MEGAFAMKKGPYCISLAKGMERKEAQEGMFHIERELRCRKGNDFVVSRETMKEETAGGLSDHKDRGCGWKRNSGIKKMQKFP